MASLRILIGVTVVISGIKLTSAEEIEYNKMTDKRISDCDHLDNDGTQYNAYSIYGRNCCMCNKGTKFVGHCNPSSPKSTKCELCPFDEHNPYNRTYVEFEPHLQVRCEKKRYRSCSKPMIYYEGSREEADRCACPAGMLEDNGNCITIPDLVSPKKDQQETNSKTLQNSISMTGMFIVQTSPSPTPPETTGQRTTSEVTANSPKGTSPTSPSIANEVKLEISNETESQQDTSTPEPGGTSSVLKNPANPDTQSPSWIIPTAIAVAVVSLAGLIFAFLYWWKRHNGGYVCGKHKGSKKSIYPGDINDENREMLRDGARSSLDVKNERNSTQETDGGNNVAYNSSTESISSNTLNVNLKAQQPVKSPVPQTDDRDNVACTTNGETINARASHVKLKAQPIIREQTNNGEDQEITPRSQTPRQGCQEEPQRWCINAHYLDELMNIAQAEQLVYHVGKEFGTRCNKNEFLPIMRDLVGFGHENKLEEFDKKYEHRTAEFIYQCMIYAYSVKGSNLTARYLLENVKKSGKNLYTEIVQQEIIKILNSPDQIPSVEYIWLDNDGQSV